MHSLYERFLRGYYQRHHPAFSADASRIRWDTTGDVDTRHLPVMVTDITLRNPASGRTLIIESEFYSRIMRERFSGSGLKYNSIHLYQIFAYVKNHPGVTPGDVSGVILYAGTGEEVIPYYYEIGGSRIGVRTLDLNQDWPRIAMQLEELCVWFEAV
jgi:5-methylcytosine-specific restriction enzyme subunit McrC